MMCLRSRLRAVSPACGPFNSHRFTAKKIKQAAAVVVATFFTLPCLAQDQPPQQAAKPESQSSPNQAEAKSPVVTIPAGTRIALVLTHPIQSRYIHRGDDIYAQINSPVNSGNEVVIPVGTFVQGTVDKLERRGGRGELRLQSMSVTFPDGYVAPVVGPLTLETDDGYAFRDPGQGRLVTAFLAPAAGAGLGALIGHSVGSASSQVTSAFPPGCVGGPPFCSTTTTPVFGTKGKDTVIGAGIGGAIGAFASIGLLFGSHHFFIDVGAPVELTLEQPITLQQDAVAKAVQESEQHPVPEQPVAPRPVPPTPPNPPTDHGTCWTPGTPGTPPQVIPGPPGPDGMPGPPTIIPGTPPTPGTPYPCP
jgi:hypothetical protein